MATRVYNKHIIPRERWLTPTQVAQFTGYSRTQIYRYIHAGLLKPKYQKRSSGTYAMRFAESEVRELFEPQSASDLMASGRVAFN